MTTDRGFHHTRINRFDGPISAIVILAFAAASTIAIIAGVI